MVQTSQIDEVSADSVTSEYKLTPAGRRLNEAMAALQDAREEGVDYRRLKQLEDEFFEAVRYFIQHLVRPFLPNNTQLAQEYFQAAYLGAVEALRTWDRTRGAASSVVAFAVRKALHRQVRQSEFPGLSDHDFTIRGKIAREVREAEDHDVDITDEEMAKILDLPASAVKRIRGYSLPSSMDRPVGDDGDTTLADLLVGEEDVDYAEFGEEAEKALILEALRRVDAEYDDLHALYTVIRVLGLDGEEPHSFPKIKSQLGKTNTESIRLRYNKYLGAMKEEAKKIVAEQLGGEVDLRDASIPALGSLTTSDNYDDTVNSFEEKVRRALEAEARLIAGDDFEVDSEDGQILLEVLEPAFRDELDALVAWHIDEIGDLEDRIICEHCLSPNSKRYRTYGCISCRKTPSQDKGDGQLFTIELPYNLATIMASRAWRRAVQRRAGTRRTGGPVEAPKQQLWAQPTLDGHVA